MGLSEFYVLHDLFDFSSLQTNVFLHSTGFLRGLLQATKAFFLQYSRLNFRLLQSTDLKNSPITVYEKSINPPLDIHTTSIRLLFVLAGPITINSSAPYLDYLCTLLTV